MARQLVPSQITYTCDACNCEPEHDIKINLSGIKNSDNPMAPVIPYSLDLCGECAVAFEAWLETYKASKQ
jgi:hypothetical protein